MNSERILCCALLIATLSGCAAPTPYLAHANLTSEVTTSTRIGIIVGGARCFLIDADGGAVTHEKKTNAMRTCMEQGALNAFSGKGYEARILAATDDEIKRVLRTYQGIHRNIRDQFPEGEAPASNPVDFGNLTEVMDRHGVDVLAVIHASGETSTAGERISKMGLLIATYALGAGIYEYDSGFADIALIGSSGSLLYYELLPSTTYDLINEESAEQIFKRLVDNIAAAAKSS